MSQVCIADIPPQVNEDLIYELVNNLSPVLGVRLIHPKSKPKGMAFVDLNSEEDVEYVLKIAKHSQIKLYGTQLRFMKPLKNDEPKRSGFGLYVANLDPKLVTEDNIRVPFERFGKISDIHIPLDSNGTPKSHAFVRFFDRENAEKAKDSLNGELILNRKCRIEYERSL